MEREIVVALTAGGVLLGGLVSFFLTRSVGRNWPKEKSLLGGEAKRSLIVFHENNPEVVKIVPFHATSNVTGITQTIQEIFQLPQPPRLVLNRNGRELSESDLQATDLVVVITSGNPQLPKEGKLVGLEVPQGPKPRPFIGNALEFQPVPDWMNRLRGLYGDIFLLHVPNFSEPVVYVSSPELLEEIYSDHKLYAKLTMKKTQIARRFGQGLFTADDDEEIWQIAHRVLLPAFSLHGMKIYFTMIQECIHELLDLWEEKYTLSNESFDPNPWLAKFTFEVIGRVALGVKFNAIRSPTLHPFLASFEKVMHIRDQQKNHPIWDKFHPATYERQLDACFSEIDTFIYDLIDKKRQELSVTESKDKDLMTLMLLAKDPVTKTTLPDRNIRDQVITFLTAGHDSTSTALTTLFYLVSQDAKVEARILKEVTTLLGPSEYLSWETMAKLDYITQVVKENLRLYPAALNITKTATRDTLLGSYFIKAETSVMISIYGTHHNSKPYPNPEKFDPDRFSPENVKKRNPFAWLPFSSGPRACIGQQLSMMEQKSLLLAGIRRFSFRLDVSAALHLTNPLFLKPNGIRLRIYKRDAFTPLPPITEKPLVEEKKHESKLIASSGVKNGKNLLILFGSNMGTSQEFANQLVAQGQAFGFDVQLATLDESVNSDFKTIPKGDQGAIIVITSTYNGQPPDNAEIFQKLASQSPDKVIAIFKDTNYTVFGCGNSQWKTYQVFPSFVDTFLQRTGAKRVYPAGQGDADKALEDDFLAWKNHMWVGLHEALGLTAMTSTEHEFPIYEVQVLEDGKKDVQALKNLLSQLGTFSTQIKVNKELQGSGSDRSTRHVEISLPEGVTYSAGDHLGICPLNHPDVVAFAASILKVKSESIVVVVNKSGAKSQYIPYGIPISVHTLLTWCIELQATASRAQLTYLASKTECPPEKRRLETLADSVKEDYVEYVGKPKRTLLEILEEFKSVSLTFGEFLAMMPSLKPRYYSISSSSKEFPDTVHVTVGVIRGTTPTGRKYYGAASHFLARSKEGEAVRVFVRDTKSSFRLPSDPSLPVILIGPGTGLAPMRGFIQERKAIEAKGLTVLFFGCRSDVDFLYREELEGYAKDKTLAHLFVAFSRKGDPKVYVQNQLDQNGEQVWDLLQKGAHIYICGDAKYMAKDVKRTFIDIIHRFGHYEEKAAIEYMAQLSATKRYCEDVWASTI